MMRSQLGNDVSMGDVDRDGLPDLIFGSYNAGAGGETYVLLGQQL